MLDRIRGFFRRRRGSPKRSSRAFAAARIDRLTADWIVSSQAIDQDIRSGGRVLVARSRDLCTNDPYARRYLALLAANVVGAQGFTIQSKVRDAKGRLDKSANRKIEGAWDDFCRRENCTVAGNLSMVDLLNLAVTGLARDGEFLCKIHRGYPNRHRFSLQPLDPEHLDFELNDERRRIVMGVEKDEWGRPVAYHLASRHPGENAYMAAAGRDRERVPADEVIHLFEPTRPGQTRGFPWTAAAMRELHQLRGYRESEVVAARAAAGKMGFFYREGDAGFPYDDKDASGNLITEVAPGTFTELPAGYRLEQFDPNHPNTAFGDFVKSALKGAASALNVSYISLANDLTETTYSSGRQGLLEERNFYIAVQRLLIEHLLDPVFRAWLPSAISAGAVALPLRDLDRWTAPVWYGRRWSWIDPEKDIAAARAAVQLGITSRFRVASEAGVDIEDTFAELAEEERMASELGIDVSGDTRKGRQDVAEIAAE